MTLYEFDLKETLPKIQGPLREILDNELECGNTIVEISQSWPMPIANVWLAKRFSADYRLKFPLLQYTYLGDPKNWAEEYIDKNLGIMLAVAASALIK